MYFQTSCIYWCNTDEVVCELNVIQSHLKYLQIGTSLVFIPAKDVEHLAEHVPKHVGGCYPLGTIHRLLVSCWQQNRLNNVLDISGAVQCYVHKRLVIHAMASCVGTVCCMRIHYVWFRSPCHSHTDITCMTVEPAPTEHYRDLFNPEGHPLVTPLQKCYDVKWNLSRGTYTHSSVAIERFLTISVETSRSTCNLSCDVDTVSTMWPSQTW